MISDPREFLRTLFDRAVEVADPMKSLAAHLPEKPSGRVVVVGAGKASARMAEAVEAVWGPCEGLVITRYGYGRPCRGIEIVEAAHPVPDEAGLEGDAAHARAALRPRRGRLRAGADFRRGLGASDRAGRRRSPLRKSRRSTGSAARLRSAHRPDEHAVRKHLSRVKGGQLAAAAHPARMLALLLSDVPGDDPAEIGSGPTVGDDSTAADVKAILS
jgi:glycerate 2-kinase